jgi:hypothetical protein
VRSWHLRNRNLHRFNRISTAKIAEITKNSIPLSPGFGAKAAGSYRGGHPPLPFAFCAFFAVKLSVHDWTAHFMRTTKMTDSHERRRTPGFCKHAKPGAHGCSV